MSKPTKTTESRSRVLRLARQMRELGYGSLPADILADRLGRPLTHAERRAHAMAMDSVSNPNPLASRMARHEQRIQEGSLFKYAVTRGFKDNQHSPKTIKKLVNGKVRYESTRSAGVRPLPKGEYMAKADLTGRGIDPDAPKRFDGNSDLKYVPIRALTGDRNYQILGTESDHTVIREGSPDFHDAAAQIDRQRPVKMNRRKSWEEDYKSK